MASPAPNTTPVGLKDDIEIFQPVKSVDNSNKQILQFKKLTIYSQKSDNESDESIQKELPDK